MHYQYVKCKKFTLSGVVMSRPLFGLSKPAEESEIVIVPVPWNANASEPTNTHEALDSLVDVSELIDLYHPKFPDMWRYGISTTPSLEGIVARNNEASVLAKELISLDGQDGDEAVSKREDLKQRLNQQNEKTFHQVYQVCQEWIEKGKLVGLIGGDHSVSLGYISMVADHCENFGVLQIDAHCDLRSSYLDNDFSHASIMHHVAGFSSVTRLVQVGVRDYSESELKAIKSAKGKIKTFFDDDIKNQLFQGKSWQSICKKIVHALPDKVYISFDVDGLTSDLCPHTGTPVPGGLSYEQVSYLFHMIHQSKKQIIGFDLVEIGRDKERQWDEKVASRILYLLCGYYSISNYD